MNTTTSENQSPGISDICVFACAEAFRGDGGIFCNPIGVIPLLGGRLARATFEPNLVCTDAVSKAILGDYPVGIPLQELQAESQPIVESYTPYRTVFDIVWSGRRHVMMGASQIDMWGNQNIAAIGDWKQPKAQLLGLRGAPGNLVNHTTSYFVPNHSEKSFVREVDVVSGPGYNRIAELGEPIMSQFEIRRVISNLGVFSFENPDRRMQIQSLHPGVSLEQVQSATSFELLVPSEVDGGEIPQTSLPSVEDLQILNNVLDPKALRKNEVA